MQLTHQHLDFIISSYDVVLISIKEENKDSYYQCGPDHNNNWTI